MALRRLQSEDLAADPPPPHDSVRITAQELVGVLFMVYCKEQKAQAQEGKDYVHAKTH